MQGYVNIEWHEPYMAIYIPAKSQAHGFGLPPKSFLEKKGLIDFLHKTLQVQQDVIDQALQQNNPSIPLSSEQVARWPL